MSLPNAAYTVVALPTLAVNAVIASTGTAFGTYAKPKVYGPIQSFGIALTRPRILVINSDGYLKVSLPTLAKDAIIRVVTPYISYFFSDSFTLSDSIAIGSGYRFSDSFTLSDSITLPLSTSVSDVFTILDNVLTSIGIVRVLADNLTLSDSLRLGLGLRFTDAFTLVDNLIPLTPAIAQIFFDTLSLSDSLRLGYGLIPRDTLTWLDAINRVTSNPSIPLTLSVSDSIVVTSGLPKNKSQWKDTAGYVYFGANTRIVTDDILDPVDQVIIDATAGGTPLNPHDNMSFGDGQSLVLGYNIMTVDAYDTMQYNWTDSVSVGNFFPASSFSADNLNFWLDSVVTSGVVAQLSFDDKFVFTDALIVRFTFLLGINDVFNLVDSLSMGREGMSADSFTLSDVVNVSLGTSSGILVSDQMNLSDNLNNVVTNTFDSDYYRRYLGDVRYGSN